MGKPRLIDPKFAKAIPIFRDKRSAETNLGIIETLALHGKLSITDIHKKMPKPSEVTRWIKTTRKKTYPGCRKDYSTINRRVQDLEQQKYVKLYREEPSRKHGKEKRIMQLTQKGWWVANLASVEVRSEWRKAFKNYEKNFGEWSPRGGQFIKMMVASPDVTDNTYNVVVIRPFRDLIVSGYVDLGIVGEYLPDIVYDKLALEFRDVMERLTKHRPPPSWVKRLARKELQILDHFFHSPQFAQVLDETVDTFRHEMETTLLEISHEAKKPHNRRSKKLHFEN